MDSDIQFNISKQREQTAMLIALFQQNPLYWMKDERLLEESGIGEIKTCNKCYQTGSVGRTDKHYILCRCVIKAIKNRKMIDIQELLKEMK